MHGNKADCSYPVCELITKVSFFFFLFPYEMVGNCAGKENYTNNFPRIEVTYITLILNFWHKEGQILTWPLADLKS